jgi:hypothetical protein
VVRREKYYEVDAGSEDAAREKAEEMFASGDTPNCEFERWEEADMIA